MSVDDPNSQSESEDLVVKSEDETDANPAGRADKAWLRERMIRWQKAATTNSFEPQHDVAEQNDVSQPDSGVDTFDAGLADSTAEPEYEETDTAPQDSRALKVLLAQDTEQVDEVAETKALATQGNTPWTLQQFFDGQIDLDVELSKRFPNMPMMSSVKFRTLGDKPNRCVATMLAQDGSSSLIIDADTRTKTMQMSFTFGSMLTLRFTFGNLNANQRQRWIEMMQRDQGGLSFLWGPDRWQEDYLVCISRTYFTNLYAFSPHNFEAGVRLAPPVMEKLLEWLKEIWLANDIEDDEPPSLLTW